MHKNFANLHIYRIPAAIFGTLWFVFLINNIILDGEYTHGFGIGEGLNGITGIITAIFIHRDFDHIFGNSLMIFVTSFLVILISGTRQFLYITIFVILGSGFFMWLTCEPNIRIIGISAVINGYFGYIITLGLLSNDKDYLKITIIILIGFGPGLAIGLVPISEFISWKGHLFGLIFGIISSFIWKDRQPIRSLIVDL